MFYRTLLGSLFLLLLLLLKGERLRPDAPPRQTAAAALSCVSMGLSWIFLYEAYQRIGVGLSSVAYYCGPVIVLLAAPLVFRKRLTAAQTACFGMVFAGLPTPPQGGEQWLWMLVLGLVNTGLGCYLYFLDIACLPVVTASILGYLEPMSAVFFAVLLLHERLSALELAGALLILAGAAVTERLRAE